MYPYILVMSKETFDLLTQNGQLFHDIFGEDYDYEIVEEKDLADKLFGHAVIMRAHLLEVFDVDHIPLDDIVIADSDVEEVPGYKNVTPLLNESLAIIDVPYEYPLKLFVPESSGEIKPRRFEYTYIRPALVFSSAVQLYKQALMILFQSDYKEVVLLKMKLNYE